mgnify:CR=1 FL=1
MGVTTMTRRRFVEQTVSVALASTLLPAGNVLAEDGKRPLTRIGLQLYTLRTPLAADFAGTLARVAAIGYKEVEFAGYYDHTPRAVADLLKENGLRAPAAHMPLDMVRDKLDQALEIAAAVGHRYLIVPWLAPDQRQSLAQYEALANLLNRAGEQCRSAGVQLGYHNHDFEFQAIDNKLPYDLLLEATDPSLVSMELDLYWITKAGHDPVDYFSRHPGRFSLCHVKDMAADGSMVDVGSGDIDFSRLLASARAAGMKHYFVEHDQPRDPLASVQSSYQALAKLAF